MFPKIFNLVLLAVFAQSAFAAGCSRSYTIAEGDICDSISREQHVSTYQLLALNPNLINQACSNLTPGESICLGNTGEDCATTYVVQDNDTCDNIAAANGLNTTILRLNNPQLDESCHIYSGEVLCTAKTVQVPAVPAAGIPNPVGGPAPPSTVVPTISTVPSVPSSAVAPPAYSAAPSAAPSAANNENGNEGDDEGDDDDNYCEEL